MNYSGSGNGNNGSHRSSSHGLTQAEKDDEMKKQLRASLDAEKNAGSKQVSQAERDEQMKRQIRANLDSQKTTGSFNMSQAQRDEQMKQQIRANLDAGRRNPTQRSQEERDEQMKKQIHANLNSEKSSNQATQAERDDAMKKQLRASLNSQKGGMTQAEKDEAMKRQIRANLAGQGNVGNQNEMTQTERDAAMKAQIRANLNQTGSQNSQAQRNEDMKRQLRASLNGPRNSSGAGGASGDVASTSQDMEHDPETGLRDSMNSSKAVPRASDTSGDGQTPGAFSVQGRAYGNLPAWGRPQNNRTSGASATPEDSDVPPEMRSNVPPELRGSLPPPEAPGSDDVHGASEDDTCAVGTSRDQSKDEKPKRRIWIYSILAVVFVGIVIAIVVVIFGSGSKVDSPKSLSPPTSHPTVSPTETPGRCEFGGKIPFGRFNDTVLDKYDYIRYTFIPTIISDFDPAALGDDPCGAMDLAISWFAYDVVTTGVEVYSSQRFLLALLYTSLGGNNWSTSNFFHYLREGWECTWERVGCDDSGRVISIDFRGIQGTSGNIPTEIGLFTSLSTYEQVHCFFGAARRISCLTFSTFLLLSAMFRSTGKLSLANNREIVGTVPTEIGRLTNLGRSVFLCSFHFALNQTRYFG